MEAGEGETAVYLKDSNILVYFHAEQSFSIGNTIRIQGKYSIREPQSPTNPGQFDTKLYYQTKGIAAICYASEAVVTDGHVRWLPQKMYQLRTRLGEQCDLLFGERQAGVMKAMLLGDKNTLEEELQNLYQKSGISHLLAISGLHVSIFGMGLYRLLRKAGCSFLTAGCPSMAAVIFYGSLTGMGTSTARAVTMFLLAVGADILGKSYDMLTALAAAALLLLLSQPLYARSASFLLSFGAVLGIGVFYPIFHSWLPVKRKHLQALLISLSIQICTLPLITYFYYEISVYSLLLNLLIIPFMTVLMLAGILAVAVSFLSLKAAWLPALLCRVILTAYEYLAEASLQLPGSVWHCGQPQKWQMAVYYAGLVILAAWQYRRMRKKGLLLMGALLLTLMLRVRSGLSFTMLDVGQGDGLVLRTASGTVCLIDGGSSSASSVGTYRILPFLKQQGMGKIDYIMVTHTDQDHISGIEELLQKAGEPGELPVGALLLTEQAGKEKAGIRLMELARAQGIEVRCMKAGDRLQDKTTVIRCLYPSAGEEVSDSNGSSMVLQVVYGEFSMILTGDLEEEGEKMILKRQNLTDCSVLKAGHHGSKTSSSLPWLEALSPELTLISCGQDNSYGHPHEEALERLRQVESAAARTDEQGALTIRSNGKTFRAESFRK
jgi:competence protein ComEC